MRGVHILQLHGQHLYARAVAVKHGLQQLGGLALNFQLAICNGRVDLAVADDLAHGRLCGIAHQRCGRGNVKKVVHRVADLVLHTELHVDDVFIAREHGGFLWNSAQLPLLEGGRLPNGAEAHLAAQNLRYLRFVY